MSSTYSAFIFLAMEYSLQRLASRYKINAVTVSRESSDETPRPLPEQRTVPPLLGESERPAYGFLCPSTTKLCLPVAPAGQSQPPNHLSMFLEVADPRSAAGDWSCFVSHRLAVVNQRTEDRTVAKESQNRYSKVCRAQGSPASNPGTNTFDRVLRAQRLGAIWSGCRLMARIISLIWSAVVIMPLQLRCACSMKQVLKGVGIANV